MAVIESLKEITGKMILLNDEIPFNKYLYDSLPMPIKLSLVECLSKLANGNLVKDKWWSKKDAKILDILNKTMKVKNLFGFISISDAKKLFVFSEIFAQNKPSRNMLRFLHMKVDQSINQHHIISFVSICLTLVSFADL